MTTTSQYYSKIATKFDRKVLSRLPYRGLQKKLAQELGLTTVTVNRRIAEGDIDILKHVLEKMLEINRRETLNADLEEQIHLEFVRAANGAMELEMKITPAAMVQAPT